MLRLINLLDNSERSVDAPTLQKEQIKNFWIEAENPTEQEMEVLSKKFDVPKDLLSPPEIATYATLHLLESNAILQFSSLDSDLNARNALPVTLCFSKDWVLTVCKKPVPAVKKAKERLHKKVLDKPSYVVYSILDEISATYFEYLERVEDQTRDIEEKMIERADKASMKELFLLKSDLITFNKLLWYERGALFSLKKLDALYMTKEFKEMVDDVHDDITRQIDIVETFREVLSDALDAYLSTVSNTINSSIKRLTVIVLYLTVISTILVFPNTVATVFGIPVIGSNVNPYFVIGLLAVSTIIPAVWLLRKQWLAPD